MTEDFLIRHCAPTLAGLKTGSLFSCPYVTQDALLASIRQINRRLHHKGLCVLPLRFYEKRALIYMYRPRQLSADLANASAAVLLQQQGYDTNNSARCLARLIQKLRTAPEFPHEIGLFLGYPPEDVRGFIENKAAHCKCVGCWKVYGNEEAARKIFAQYKKCTQVYCDLWAKGKAIERLAVPS